MNYEKYLDAAGLTDPDLRAKCLAYLAQCESQYSAAGIRRHKLTAWAVVGWLLLTNKVQGLNQ